MSDCSTTVPSTMTCFFKNDTRDCTWVCLAFVAPKPMELSWVFNCFVFGGGGGIFCFCYANSRLSQLFQRKTASCKYGSFGWSLIQPCLPCFLKPKHFLNPSFPTAENKLLQFCSSGGGPHFQNCLHPFSEVCSLSTSSYPCSSSCFISTALGCPSK